MRIFLVSAVVFALLSTVFFEQADAVPIAWFARIAMILGVKLAKNSYYARCNTRFVPAGMSCPGVVYGVGFSKNQAQNSARFYADTVGDSGCGRYVGHCQIYKFAKRRGR